MVDGRGRVREACGGRYGTEVCGVWRQHARLARRAAAALDASAPGPRPPRSSARTRCAQ